VSYDSSNLWSRVSASTGVPLDGLRFVYDVFDFMQQHETSEASCPEKQKRHCTAAEYCEAFIGLAKEKFGADYVAALFSWNLETSDKLGRLFYALINRNLMGKQDSDHQNDFDGQFDFSSVVTRPLPTGPYNYPAASLAHPIYVRATTRQLFARVLYAVLIWCGALAIAIALSDYLQPFPEIIVAYAIVIAFVLLQSKIRYPYRYSLRSLLTVMTLVAVALGIIKYMAG
jgi:uncharacterized repeat protein (TIGR04138 family)